jgi:hypothetical protein
MCTTYNIIDHATRQGFPPNIGSPAIDKGDIFSLMCLILHLIAIESYHQSNIIRKMNQWKSVKYADIVKAIYKRIDA